MTRYEGNEIVKEIGGRMLRKTCIHLSSSTFTRVDYFEELTLKELGEVVEDVVEVTNSGKKK